MLGMGISDKQITPKNKYKNQTIFITTAIVSK